MSLSLIFYTTARSATKRNQGSEQPTRQERIKLHGADERPTAKSGREAYSLTASPNHSASTPSTTGIFLIRTDCLHYTSDDVISSTTAPHKSSCPEPIDK
ncbi:hypothetical protein TNCV_5038051 [Trichonephila clavipes]|nr:hypothetical protein TNCV_5038051 [Trichonephila clavipes]